MSKYNFFFAMGLLLTIASCSNKVDGVPVDEELVPFFELFEEEAAKRGVVFDNSVERIEGYIQNIVETGVVGACKRNAENETNPQIFFDRPYWRAATLLEREYVMFHELGHCFLKLGHDNTPDSNNVCASIMASGLGECDEIFNANNREALLDELFSK